MARTVRDANLDNREARSRLEARGRPHYRLIEPGLHLGYRKPKGRKGKPAGAGQWVARYYLGGQSYSVERIGVADDYSDADGTFILSFREAQNKARERMVRRVHSAAGVTGPLTVAQAVEAYLPESDGKLSDAQHRANAFILPALGDIEVASLTSDVLRKWHSGLAKLPARVRTKVGKPQQHRAHDDGDGDAVRRRRASANRVLAILKAALNLAWRDSKVSSNSAWARVKPFENVDAARVRYLTIAEAKRFINACDADFRPLVQAALQTGCRYGELTRLKVQDFNPDSGTVVICKSKSNKVRHVVLTDEGVALFTQLAAGRSGGELLLRRADGTAWGPSHQDRRMAEACERAKIKRITFHGTRHTWASHAVMNNMSLLVVARNLGHANTKMVEKHYGHLAPSYIADAIRAGAPRFGFKPDPKLAALTAKR